MANYISETYGSKNNILLMSCNNNYFLVCYLGILLSGNVCVPVDPSIEPGNLNFIARKAGVVAGFFQSKILKKQPDFSFDTITDKDYEKLIENQPLFQLNPSFDSTQPALIIFTSGSTGYPKGVLISHKNIIANTSSIIEYLKLSQNDIAEVVLPFYYCYGLSLLHSHLRVGGSIVLNNNFMLIGAVLNDINKYKCSCLAGVPSHFQILLRKSDSFKKSKFPSLRYVTQAGGKLHNCFIKEFKRYFPDVDFYVMYGQTEATARLSYLDPKELDEKMGSIGKGIPGVRLKVVGSDGLSVKPGETGEIIAKGDNIMLGYFKDPEATQSTIKNEWLYTGDIGTVDKDGYIFLTARKKEIIKVAGKRVSLKEIEEVIVSHLKVVDCIIEAIDDDITGEAIKAIVVFKEGEKNSISDDDLRAYCSKRLSSYKIPKIIEFTNRVVCNSTGKKVRRI